MGIFMGNPNLPLIVKNSLVYSFKHDMKVVGEYILTTTENICMCARRVSGQATKKNKRLAYGRERVPDRGQVLETPNVP
jgi:hypothetical protein